MPDLAKTLALHLANITLNQLVHHEKNPIYTFAIDVVCVAK